MPERDELDLLIDAALADYAEPRPRLEQRMLARVSHTIPRRSRRSWVLATFALPVAALALLVVYVAVRPHSQPVPPPYTAAVPSPARETTTTAAPILEKSSSRLAHRSYKNVHRVNESALARPKLDIFPTPQPLSAQEQALSRFAAQAPEADRKALIEAQQQAAEPLRISAIRIPPLQSPEDENH